MCIITTFHIQIYCRFIKISINFSDRFLIPFNVLNDQRDM